MSITHHTHDFLQRTGLTLEQANKAEMIIAIARAMVVEEFDKGQIKEFDLAEYGIADKDKSDVVEMGMTLFDELVYSVRIFDENKSALHVKPWLGSEEPD